jgi:ribose 5-phosphate isomerase
MKQLNLQRGARYCKEKEIVRSKKRSQKEMECIKTDTGCWILDSEINNNFSDTKHLESSIQYLESTVVTNRQMQQQELIPHLFRTEFRKITAVLCKHFWN